MFNKIYDKIKKFIKEEYKTLIFFGILYFIVLCPVNYYIITGGGTVDIKDRVQIKNSYKSKGSMRLAYVSQIKGTILTYGLSFIVPSWEKESMDDYKYSKEEKVSDLEFRDDLDLKVANEWAIYHAYDMAGKKFQIKKSHLYIIYVEEHNKKMLNVGDEILEVKGEKVNSFDDFSRIITSCSDKEKIKIKLLRGKKEIEREVEVYLENGKLMVGVMVSRLDDYKTSPEVSLKFRSSESGPSGGMMLTLDIYNKLTKKDITKGLNIVGTGTIEEDGSIGEIGGVKYKLMGAVKDKADVFIVPSNNYKEALKCKKENNYNIKLIKAINIRQVLNEMKKIKK